MDLAQDTSPLDPRVRVHALEIVKGIPEAQRDERARAVYGWVLDHIEDGQEKDGRRVVIGRSGSRQSAFLHLMRQLGIPIDLAVVKDRLAIPPIGPMSDVDNYDSLALRLDTGHGSRWLTVHDKFAPYGYVPAEERGQACLLLVPGTPRDTVTSPEAVDGLEFEGRADLREDGSASVDLAQSFAGNVGIQMRNVLDKVAEGQLHDFVESRLIGRNMPGARLRDLKIENAKNLGAPLILRTHLEVPQFARTQGGQVVLTPLFPVHLSHLSTLPQRQTPLFLPTWAHVEVKFEVIVPKGMRVPASLPQGEARDGERLVVVKDTVVGHALELSRLVDVPAGRVQPGEYARFQRFTEDADALVEREIALGR